MNRRSFFGAVLALIPAMALARKADAEPMAEITLTFGPGDRDIARFYASPVAAEKLRRFATGGLVRSVKVESEVLWEQR